MGISGAFQAADESYLNHLDQNGYAVVKAVISKEKAQEYVDRILNWLESFPYGFKKDDASTHKLEFLPANMKGGMYHGYSCQHEAFVWELRQEPGVIDAFAKVWGTRNLLSSFDGINMTFPPSTEEEQRPSTPWPHVDQSPTRNGRQCVQGLTNLAPNGPLDGGLTLISGSHALFDDFFAEFGDEVQKGDWGSEDWRGLNDEQVAWFTGKGCEIVKVCADAGDLILWDGRTVHWNTRPQGENLRALIYTCYTPAAFATPDDLERKRAIFKAWQGSTHWPHTNLVAHSSKAPRLGLPDTYTRERPIVEPVLTPQLLRLAGIESY